MDQQRKILLNEITNPLNYNYYYLDELNAGFKSKKKNTRHYNVNMNLNRTKNLQSVEPKSTKLCHLNYESNLNRIGFNSNEDKLSKYEKKISNKLKYNSNFIFNSFTLQNTTATNSTSKSNKPLALPPILAQSGTQAVLNTAREFNRSMLKSFESTEDVKFEKLNQNTGKMELPAITIIFKSEPAKEISFDNFKSNLRGSPVKLPLVRLNQMKISEARKKSAKNMWFNLDSLSFTPDIHKIDIYKEHHHHHQHNIDNHIDHNSIKN